MRDIFIPLFFYIDLCLSFRENFKHYYRRQNTIFSLNYGRYENVRSYDDYRTYPNDRLNRGV